MGLVRITGLQEKAHNAAKLAMNAIRAGWLDAADRWLVDARSHLQALRKQEAKVAEVVGADAAKVPTGANGKETTT